MFIGDRSTDVLEEVRNCFNFRTILVNSQITEADGSKVVIELHSFGVFVGFEEVFEV